MAFYFGRHCVLLQKLTHDKLLFRGKQNVKMEFEISLCVVFFSGSEEPREETEIFGEFSRTQNF